MKELQLHDIEQVNGGMNIVEAFVAGWDAGRAWMRSLLD